MRWPRRPKNWIWAIRNSSYTVLLDACVLYPAPLRDFLIELAAAGLFRAKWTNRIHDEWIESLLEKRTDLTREMLERTRDLMNSAVLDCLVEGYEDLIPALNLPDQNDRHVLAAAISSSCDAVVTFNRKDFPKGYLEKFSIERLDPDDFIHHQFGLNHAALISAARRCRKQLRNPEKSAEEYLDTLEKQGLPKSVSQLRPYQTVI